MGDMGVFVRRYQVSAQNCQYEEHKDRIKLTKNAKKKIRYQLVKIA